MIEPALVKIEVDLKQDRTSLLQMVEHYHGKVVDYANDSVVIRTAGTSDKLNAFIDLLQQWKIIELVRSGKSYGKPEDCPTEIIIKAQKWTHDEQSAFQQTSLFGMFREAAKFGGLIDPHANRLGQSGKSDINESNCGVAAQADRPHNDRATTNGRSRNRGRFAQCR